MNTELNIEKEELAAIELILEVSKLSLFSDKIKTLAIAEIIENVFTSPAFNRGYEAGESDAKVGLRTLETTQLRQCLIEIIQECNAIKLTTTLEERILNTCKDALKASDNRLDQSILNNQPS
jgi:geranylgeranyl pyrophosphate synthase